MNLYFIGWGKHLIRKLGKEKEKFLRGVILYQIIRNLMPILVSHSSYSIIKHPHGKTHLAQSHHSLPKHTLSTLGPRFHSRRWTTRPLRRICRSFHIHSDSQYRNDLWSYDTVSMVWTEIQTEGEIPAIRSNATLHFCPQGQQLILFGGGGPNKSRYNDVCLLDWETKHWTRLLPPQGENSPWERTYHSS